MTIDEQLWTELAQEPSGSGLIYRRLYPGSHHDLRVGIDRADRRRRLIHTRPWHPTDPAINLPQSRAVGVETHLHPDRTNIDTTVTLLDPAYADVFTTLVRDVAAAAAATDTTLDAASALSARLWHWKQLLEGMADQGLPLLARRGLFGELTTLEQLIDAGMAPLAAILSWSGPAAANQDFQLQHCAIEVKTTSGKPPQTLLIASERELDDAGVGALFLVHLSVDERRGGSGISLNTLCDRLSDRATQSPPADQELADRLHLAGYFPAHRHLYDEPRYTPRAHAVYQVSGDFPRIIETQLASGVGDVRYAVALSACDPFRTTDQHLQSYAGVNVEQDDVDS